MPTVSVIVPVYKVEKYLPRCLESVLVQTFTDFELICINDGSPDSCLQILESYAQRDKRIKVFSQENQGLSMARNNGLKQASGQYIYFLDSDDYIHPQCLEIAIYFAKQYQADLISFDFVKGSNDKILHNQYQLDKIPFKITDSPVFLGTSKKTWRIAFNSWSKLFKREILDGIDFIGGIHFEDYPHTLAVLSKKPLTVVLKASLYFYTLNENSISHQKVNPSQIRDYHIGVRSVFEKYASPQLVRERIFLRKHFLWRILKHQFKLCQWADSENRLQMFTQFATELRDLVAQNLLSWHNQHLITYWAYRKIMKDFPQNATDSPKAKPFRVAIFASYDSEGKIHDYVLNYIQKLKQVCQKIVFVADNEAVDLEQKKLDGLVEFKQFHRHGEYDFGSYKIGYEWLLKQEWVNQVDELVICNDSCFTVGAIKPVFDMMSFSRCDFWGMTLANTRKPHLQSFFLVFKKNVFHSVEFKDFIKSIKSQKRVLDVILNYEVPLKALLEKAGFRGTGYIQNLKSPHQRPLTTLSKGMPLVKKKCFLKPKISLEETSLEGVGRLLWKIKKISRTDYDSILSFLKESPFWLTLRIFCCFYFIKIRRFFYFRKMKENGDIVFKIFKIPVYRLKIKQKKGI